MDIHLYIHNDESKVFELSHIVLNEITHIKNQLNKMAQTLDDVLADVQAESEVDDSIVTLVQGLAQQLKDALSGATLPPAVQEKVEAVFAGIEANKQKVADAVKSNTPTA